LKKLLLILTISAITAFAYKNIENSDVEQLVADGAIIVDVRLDEEWRESGVLPKSLLVTYFDKTYKPMMKEFLSAVKASAPDKSRPIIVVCRTGQRSITASQALDKEGYKNVYNLKYGVMGWLYERRKLNKYPAN
jgi:rhodanese-related sulfurtransferase